MRASCHFPLSFIWLDGLMPISGPSSCLCLIKDTNRKIRTTFSIELCVKILVPNYCSIARFVSLPPSFIWLDGLMPISGPSSCLCLIKDTNRKIRTTYFIEYCGKILVPISSPVSHSALLLLVLSHPFTCV